MIAKRKLLVTGTVAVTAIVLAACGNSGDKQATEATGSAAVTTTATASAANHNQADVTFAQQMIPHHSQAVEMSDIVLTKQDIDPRVTELAQQIKAAQGPEIEQLQSLLAAWGQPTVSSGTGMPMTSPGAGMPGHGMPMTSMPMAAPETGVPGHGAPMTSMPMASPGTGMPGGGTGGMSGMMSPEDMAALGNAQGVDASRMFLEQMIEHHSGAIEMARIEIETGTDPDAVAMAHAIADTQQQEIATMQNILSSL